jgi:hypothetical protein
MQNKLADHLMQTEFNSIECYPSARKKRAKTKQPAR